MQILLTNDDGIYAPGLRAIEEELRQIGDVCVVAPALEQSGVGHSITFLRPLVGAPVYDGKRQRGWAVEGTPADCVKLAVSEYCPTRPDLVVSGINGGLNAGINILYSGTLGAAIEGSFFGIRSVAVSLEYETSPNFTKAAAMARDVIEQILDKDASPSGSSSLAGPLYNINIPTAAIANSNGLKTVPMGLARYGEHFLKRTDPKGRDYFWATGDPPPQDEGHETDLTALAKGFVTLTPLEYDMTRHSQMESVTSWNINLRG